MRPVPHTQGASSSPEIRAGELLDAYGNNILRLAYSYLRNLADAEDVLQETLVRYLVARPELNGPDHEKAWLLRVAANLAKNRLRDNVARAAEELNEELDAEDPGADPAADRENLSAVWEAVAQLPPDQREAVHLYYAEGYTTHEVAQIVGRKDATVRSDLHRARKALRDILGEAFDLG